MLLRIKPSYCEMKILILQVVILMCNLLKKFIIFIIKFCNFFSENFVQKQSVSKICRFEKFMCKYDIFKSVFMHNILNKFSMNKYMLFLVILYLGTSIKAGYAFKRLWPWNLRRWWLLSTVFKRCHWVKISWYWSSVFKVTFPFPLHFYSINYC